MYEQPSSLSEEESVPHTKELSLAEKNSLQVLLADRAKIDLSEWIEKNAQKFHIAIHENPGLYADLYHSDPEECIEILEEQIKVITIH
jgi:hypothetical protein